MCTDSNLQPACTHLTSCCRWSECLQTWCYGSVDPKMERIRTLLIAFLSVLICAGILSGVLSTLWDFNMGSLCLHRTSIPRYTQFRVFNLILLWTFRWMVYIPANRSIRLREDWFTEPKGRTDKVIKYPNISSESQQDKYEKYRQQNPI